MLFKIITFFLIGMAALAFFGGLRRKRQVAQKCPRCGAPRVGKGPCACGAR